MRKGWLIGLVLIGGLLLWGTGVRDSAIAGFTPTFTPTETPTATATATFTPTPTETSVPPTTPAPPQPEPPTPTPTLLLPEAGRDGSTVAGAVILGLGAAAILAGWAVWSKRGFSAQDAARGISDADLYRK